MLGRTYSIGYEPDFGPWISECAAQFVPCVSEQMHAEVRAGE